MVTNFSKLSHPVVVGKDDNNGKEVVSRDLIKVNIFYTALNEKTTEHVIDYSIEVKVVSLSDKSSSGWKLFVFLFLTFNVRSIEIRMGVC